MRHWSQNGKTARAVYTACPYRKLEFLYPLEIIHMNTKGTLPFFQRQDSDCKKFPQQQVASLDILKCVPYRVGRIEVARVFNRISIELPESISKEVQHALAKRPPESEC